MTNCEISDIQYDLVTPTTYLRELRVEDQEIIVVYKKVRNNYFVYFLYNHFAKVEASMQSHLGYVEGA